MGAALIPLDVKPAQIDSPMQTIGGLMQMRSQITENALRQAQTQAQIAQTADVQAQAAQRQRAMQDQNTLQQMLADQQHPEYAKALGSGDTSFLNGKVSPQFQATISNQMVENLKNRAALTGTQLDNNVKAHDTIEQGLMGLQGLPSNADRVQQLHSLVGQWQQAGYLKDLPNAVQMAQQYDGSPEMTQKFASVNGLLYGMNQKAAAMQKEQASTAEAAGKGAQAQAEASKSTAEAQVLQRQADALRNLTPDNLNQQIDTVIDPSKYAGENARTKAMAQQAIKMGLPMTAVQATIKDGADRIGREEAAIAQAKATVPVKIQVGAGIEAAKNAVSALTPEALDMAAELYRSTGQMPQLGMRNPQAMRQILIRAAELGPINIASEQAAYAANKGSLIGLVKNRDAVSAFENTAGKNLDLLLQEGRKVIDSGSPWINTPLREIDAKALGNTDLPAFNAARQVAINEIAKVTSNPGLAGQLTDSARREVENFIPASATLAQTMNVAQVLRQDMQNRHQAYNQQIDDIQKRIGKGGNVQDNTTGGNNAPAANQFIRTSTGPGGHKIGQKADGGWYDVQTGAKVQ